MNTEEKLEVLTLAYNKKYEALREKVFSNDFKDLALASSRILESAIEFYEGENKK